MLRETKINLYVVLALLAVMGPGAVILFVKKLDPTARRLGQPDPVDQSRPYMDPVTTPDSVPRTAPPLTRGWVRAVLSDHLGRETVDLVRGAARGDVPVVSDGRRLQLAYLGPGGRGGWRAVFVFWSDALPTGEAACRFAGGSVLEAWTTDLPKHVRAELQENQFINPPRKVQWFDVDFPGDAKPSEIAMTYDNRGGEATETVRVP